jgi:heptosyltransferase-3
MSSLQRKYLVLKRDKLGDLLLTTPLLAELRRQDPTARIDLYASEYNGWVAEGNRNIDNIFCYPKVRWQGWKTLLVLWKQCRQIVQLRQQRYTAVIVAQGEYSHRAMQRGRWVAGKSTRLIGYTTQPASTDTLPEPHSGHETQRMLQLLHPLGFTAPAQATHLDFTLPQHGQAFAERWLTSHQLEAGQYIVLGLGARRARRQPSAEQILRWASWLYATYHLKMIFMWTPGPSGDKNYPGDDATAAPVLAAEHHAILPFRGPLIEALGLVAHARLNVFPDSGLMHFAAASPGGVIGLFGDTESWVDKWHPIGPLATHLCHNPIADLPDDTFKQAVSAALTLRSHLR